MHVYEKWCNTMPNGGKKLKLLDRILSKNRINVLMASSGTNTNLMQKIIRNYKCKPKLTTIESQDLSLGLMGQSFHLIKS